jgi:hypothetical protein
METYTSEVNMKAFAKLSLVLILAGFSVQAHADGAADREAVEKARFTKRKEEVLKGMDDELVRIQARAASIQQTKSCMGAANVNKDFEICRLEQQKRDDEARIEMLKKRGDH